LEAGAACLEISAPAEITVNIKFYRRQAKTENVVADKEAVAHNFVPPIREAKSI
jgi:hypothetical protein